MRDRRAAAICGKSSLSGNQMTEAGSVSNFYETLLSLYCFSGRACSEFPDNIQGIPLKEF